MFFESDDLWTIFARAVLFSCFFGYEGKKGKKESEEEEWSKERNCIEATARLRFKKAMVSKSSKVREERELHASGQRGGDPLPGPLPGNLCSTAR